MFTEAICAQHRGREQEFEITLMKPKSKFGERIGFVELTCMSISIFKGPWNCHSQTIGVKDKIIHVQGVGDSSHAEASTVKVDYLKVDYKSGSLGSLETLLSQGYSWAHPGSVGRLLSELKTKIYLSEQKTVLMKQGGTSISSAPSMCQGVSIHHLS